MTYSYFIENNTDNSSLFVYIQTVQLHEDFIYTDKLDERIEIKKLFKMLKSNDILIVRSIQDLGSNITQILRVLNWLIEHNVDLISICEDYYSGDTYKELLVDLLKFDTYFKEKCRISGFEEAKEAGKVGRPRSSKIEEAIAMYESKKFTANQIQELISVSPSTLFRALRDRQPKIKCE